VPAPLSLGLVLHSFPFPPARNALGPIHPTQLLPTAAAAAPAWPCVWLADAKRCELPRKIIHLILLALQGRQREAYTLWYGSLWLEIATLRPPRPPSNVDVLLVDLPLQVLAVPVARGVDDSVPRPGVRRRHVRVAASKFSPLEARICRRWTIAAFWARPGRWMTPLGTAIHSGWYIWLKIASKLDSRMWVPGSCLTCSPCFLREQYLLRVPILVVRPCSYVYVALPRSRFTFPLHVSASRFCFMFPLHVSASRFRFTYLLHVPASRFRFMFPLHVSASRPRRPNNIYTPFFTPSLSLN